MFRQNLLSELNWRAAATVQRLQPHEFALQMVDTIEVVPIHKSLNKMSYSRQSSRTLPSFVPTFLRFLVKQSPMTGRESSETWPRIRIRQQLANSRKEEAYDGRSQKSESFYWTQSSDGRCTVNIADCSQMTRNLGFHTWISEISFD